MTIGSSTTVVAASARSPVARPADIPTIAGTAPAMMRPITVKASRTPVMRERSW